MLNKYINFILLIGFLLAALPDHAAAQNIESQLNSYFQGLQQPKLSKTSAGKLIKLDKHDGRSLTPMLVLARQNWSALTLPTKAMISPWFARPSNGVNLPTGLVGYQVSGNPETFINTIHFKIHYIDKAAFPADINAATTAFANQVAIEIENTWTVEHNTLGYALPPSDATSPSGNGGDGLYDIYLMQLGAQGLFGYVTQDSIGTVDATRPNGSWSYLVMDNDFSQAEFGYANPLLPLQVTAAHEYFHSIQFGYDIGEQPAFMEQSSTWMEDVVYPTVHDNYQYIGEPYTDSNGNGQYDIGEPFVDRDANAVRASGSLDFPEYELDAFSPAAISLIQYGRFLWTRYLTEKFNNSIMKSIWGLIGATAGDNAFAAMDQALLAQGSSLSIAYQEYAAWGYDKTNFIDGVNYPLVWVDQNIAPASSTTSANSPSLNALASSQRHLSSVYVQVLNPVQGSYSFTTGGAGALAVTALTDSGTGALTQTPIPIAAGAGNWIMPLGLSKVVFVVSNISPTDGLTWNITYNAPVASAPPVAAAGGGGCVISQSVKFDPILILMIILCGVYLSKRRKPMGSIGFR